MSLAIDQPWWLLLVIVGLVSGIVGWRAMRGISVVRRVLANGARVLLFLSLALAMSGVYRVERADALTVIAAVDVSGSVTNFARFGSDELGLPITIDRAARGFLGSAMPDRKPEDRLGLIAFDAAVQTIATPSTGVVLDRAISKPPIDGTDLPSALLAARSLIPPDTNGRVVLFSDGRSTRSGLEQVPTDIQIDVVPIRYQIDSEVIVESVDLPARSLPGSEVEVRVVVRSLGNSTGEIVLSDNGQDIDLDPQQAGKAKRVQLGPGQRVLVFPVKLGPARVHRFRARYIPDFVQGNPEALVGDTSQGNNSAGGITLTSGDGRVLLISPQNDDASNDGDELARVYSGVGWEVDRRLPGQMPRGLIDLEGYDLVVLVNTARDAVPMGSDDLLSAYARDLGGGVIFVGGTEALGAGGWQGSSIEEILPLRLDVADDLIVPQVAVVIVLDSSGSMRRSLMGSSRTQQAIANESAAEALRVLDEKDLVGVVAFNNSAREVVPIGPNDPNSNAGSRIESIGSGGGTNIVPAITMAQRMLESVEANSKHIVLLSDGESQTPELLPGIAEDLGKLGIKVSTIAVGDDADESTMRAVAVRSGGVYYRVSNPSALPRIFLKAIRVVRTPMIREGWFTPVALDSQSPATGPLGALPDLGGLVVTERIENDPRVATPIVTSHGEPVLAFRQVELGRVAVFTSDASRWAQRWIDQGNFDRFWGALGAWAIRSGKDEPGELSLSGTQDGAEIEYNAIDERGSPIDGLDVQVQIFDESGSTTQLALEQVGAGRYIGRSPALSRGVHVLIASPSRGGEPMPPSIAGLEISGSDEFAHLRAAPQALIDLAQRSGGRVFELNDPQSASLFSRDGLSVRRSLQPVWTTLIAIAFVLFLIDLAMRRVAFDRWVAQAREDTIAAARSVRGEQLQQAFAARQQTRASAPETPDIDRSPMKQSKPETKSEPEPKAEEPKSDNPLMAAKRRAREQFDD